MSANAFKFPCSRKTSFPLRSMLLKCWTLSRLYFSLSLSLSFIQHLVSWLPQKLSRNDQTLNTLQSCILSDQLHSPASSTIIASAFMKLQPDREKIDGRFCSHASSTGLSQHRDLQRALVDTAINLRVQ
jgi:hypothetical protein